MLTQSQTERLLSDLCVELGFCLPPTDQQRLCENPPGDVDAFTNAVFAAEGCAEISTGDRDIYRTVKAMVADAFNRAQEIVQFADDLEALMGGTLSETEFRDAYNRADAPDVVCAVWENLEHYLADEDIRKKDPHYRLMQDGEMSTLVNLLRSGAPKRELKRVSFLTRT